MSKKNALADLCLEIVKNILGLKHQFRYLKVSMIQYVKTAIENGAAPDALSQALSSIAKSLKKNVPVSAKDEPDTSDNALFRALLIKRILEDKKIDKDLKKKVQEAASDIDLNGDLPSPVRNEFEQTLDSKIIRFFDIVVQQKKIKLNFEAREFEHIDQKQYSEDDTPEFEKIYNSFVARLKNASMRYDLSTIGVFTVIMDIVEQDRKKFSSHEINVFVPSESVKILNKANLFTKFLMGIQAFFNFNNVFLGIGFIGGYNSAITWMLLLARLASSIYFFLEYKSIKTPLKTKTQIGIDYFSFIVKKAVQSFDVYLSLYFISGIIGYSQGLPFPIKLLGENFSDPWITNRNILIFFTLLLKFVNYDNKIYICFDLIIWILLNHTVGCVFDRVRVTGVLYDRVREVEAYLNDYVGRLPKQLQNTVTILGKLGKDTEGETYIAKAEYLSNLYDEVFLNNPILAHENNEISERLKAVRELAGFLNFVKGSVGPWSVPSQSQRTIYNIEHVPDSSSTELAVVYKPDPPPSPASFLDYIKSVIPFLFVRDTTSTVTITTTTTTTTTTILSGTNTQGLAKVGIETRGDLEYGMQSDVYIALPLIYFVVQRTVDTYASSFFLSYFSSIFVTLIASTITRNYYNRDILWNEVVQIVPGILFSLVVNLSHTKVLPELDNGVGRIVKAGGPWVLVSLGSIMKLYFNANKIEVSKELILYDSDKTQDKNTIDFTYSYSNKNDALTATNYLKQGDFEKHGRVDENVRYQDYLDAFQYCLMNPKNCNFSAFYEEGFPKGLNPIEQYTAKGSKIRLAFSTGQVLFQNIEDTETDPKMFKWNVTASRKYKKKVTFEIKMRINEKFYEQWLRKNRFSINYKNSASMVSAQQSITPSKFFIDNYSEEGCDNLDDIKDRIVSVWQNKNDKFTNTKKPFIDFMKDNNRCKNITRDKKVTLKRINGLGSQFMTNLLIMPSVDIYTYNDPRDKKTKPMTEEVRLDLLELGTYLVCNPKVIPKMGDLHENSTFRNKIARQAISSIIRNKKLHDSMIMTDLRILLGITIRVPENTNASLRAIACRYAPKHAHAY